MTGAMGLEGGVLEGEILLNLDTEEDDEIGMGCAGGVDASATFTLENETVPAGFESFNLSISGLKGGHSGVDIHTGRANANKLLVRFLLSASQDFGIQLTDGNKIKTKKTLYEDINLYNLNLI